MGLRHRSSITGANVFFVTSSVRDNRHSFSNAETRDNVEGFLFDFFPDYADILMGYVIMPSHVHLLVGCRSGGKQLSRFMQSFKSMSARKLFPGAGSIWQCRFDDLVITTERQFQIKLDYIHYNPVRKGYVLNPIDWKWSSAKFWIRGEDQRGLTRTWEWIE